MLGEEQRAVSSYSERSYLPYYFVTLILAIFVLFLCFIYFLSIFLGAGQELMFLGVKDAVFIDSCIYALVFGVIHSSFKREQEGNLILKSDESLLQGVTGMWGLQSVFRDLSSDLHFVVCHTKKQ